MLLLNNRRGAIHGAKVLGVGAGPALPRPRPGRGGKGRSVCFLPWHGRGWNPSSCRRCRQEEGGCIDSLPAVLRLTFSGLKSETLFSDTRNYSLTHAFRTPLSARKWQLLPREVSLRTHAAGARAAKGPLDDGEGAAGVS